MNLQFKSNTPCNNCPYRKDAPLQHWDRVEFNRLKQTEETQFGTVYGCHKNNGSVCAGWLMIQDRNRLPSIALRLKLMSDNVDRSFLDSLHAPCELYASVDEMIKANYPEL